MIDEHERLLNSSEIYYLCMSSLLMNGKSSIVPEALLIMRPDQFIRFIKVFGGYTVRVPSINEFRLEMLSCIALYYRTVGRTWPWIFKKLEIKHVQRDSMMRSVEKLEAYIETSTDSTLTEIFRRME